MEVEGELTEDGWVIDFGALKEMTRALCRELDHKFLLQRESKALEIEEGMSNWKVRFRERGWVFPKSDVVALPVENSTAEQLAHWFAGAKSPAFVNGVLDSLARELGLPQFFPVINPTPSPAHLHGIEINRYAHELAQMTIRIG